MRTPNLNLTFVPVTDIPHEWRDGRPLLALQEATSTELVKASVPVGPYGTEEVDPRWRVVWWNQEHEGQAGSWASAYSRGSDGGGHGPDWTASFGRWVEPAFLAELPALMEGGDVDA